MISYSEAGPMVVTPSAPRTDKVLIPKWTLLARAEELHKRGDKADANAIRTACFQSPDPVSVGRSFAERIGFTG